MKKLFGISILVAVIFLGECNNLNRFFGGNDADKDDTSCLKVDVDKYLDKVLEKARDELPDPMRLPPRSTFVELSDGVLWGMSNITRLGEAEVTCDGDQVIIKSKITTDEVKGRYTWTKKWRRDKGGYVVFLSNDFRVDVKVVIEKKKGKVTSPKLERFVIKKFKDNKIEITGKGLLTSTLSELTKLFSEIFQKVIAKAVQDPMKEALVREMRDIKIKG